MMRKLKVPGVALAVVCVAGAISMPSASAQFGAQGSLTANGPFMLDIAEVGEFGNSLTAFGGTIACPGSSYSGHEYESHSWTTHKTETEAEKEEEIFDPPEAILSGATTVTVSPKYAPCNAVSGGSEFSTTVDLANCDFVFHVGGTTSIKGEEEGTYDVTLDIECGAIGDAIHITQFSGTSHGFRVCSITIPGQTGLDGAHLTDEGNGHLQLKGFFNGITASRSGLCGSSEEGGAVMHVNWTVSGTDALGSPTAVSISDW